VLGRSFDIIASFIECLLYTGWYFKCSAQLSHTKVHTLSSQFIDNELEV
jgi:hypothetical protein